MRLKIRHFLSFDESGGVYHLLNAGVYILLDAQILRLQVNHLNLSHSSTKYSTSLG